MSQIFYSKMMEKLEDRSVSFVFPSEIVKQRATHFALESGVQALELNRFLSWDHFKSKFLCDYKADCRPFSTLDLLFFCYEVVAENKGEKPLFHQIIPSEFHGLSENFIDNIQQAVSSFFLLESDFEGLMEGELLADLKKLKNLYDRFLERNRLYEIEVPSHLDEQKLEGLTFYLFFPDLFLDLPEYRKLLQEGEAKGFFVSIGKKEEVKKVVDSQSTLKQQFYPDGKEEVKAILEKIQTLSDQQGEIVITVADEALLPFFRYYAPLYDIPIEWKKGDLLSSSIEGSFFSKIVNVIDQHFQFEAVRDLFLNHYPLWKSHAQENIKKILSAAVEGGALRGRSAWEHAIACLGNGYQKEERVIASIQKKRDLLLAFWNELVLSMEAIAHASTLLNLSYAVKNFIEKYIDDQEMAKLDEKELPTPNYKRFQMVLSSLKELIDHEEKIYSDDATLSGNPFSFWMRYLSMKVYVPQRREGIPLYPYRVAAGGYYDYHFICGLSAKSSKVLQEKATFLGEREKSLWLENQNEEKRLRLVADFTQEYLQTYSLSGKTVFISGSAEIKGNFHILPSYWYSQNRYEEIVDGVKDPLESQLEKQWEPLSSLLYRGFQNYSLTQSIEKEKLCINYTKIPIANISLLQEIESQVKKEKFSFSGSRLEIFRKCPWRGLLSTLIGDPQEKKPQAVKSTDRGKWLHGAMQHFFEHCKAQEQLFLFHSPDHHQKMGALKKAVIEKYFDNLEREKNGETKMPLPAIWQSLKPQLIQSVSLAIDQLWEKLGVIDVDQCEKAIVVDYGNYSLNGRLDALLFDIEKNPVIIDYKNRLSVDWKKLLPKESFLFSSFHGMVNAIGLKEREELPTVQTEAELFEKVDDYFPTSFQMAIYQELVQKESSADQEPSAFYYNFSGEKGSSKKNGYIVKYPDGFFSEKQEKSLGQIAQTLRALVHLFVKRMIDSFCSGDFTLWENPDCTYCPYQSICRQDYFTKERGIL